MTDLDDIFEAEAARIAAEAEAADASAAIIAQRQAKREAEQAKHIRQGVMTADGDYIETEEADDEDESDEGEDDQ
jgi:hypothetical protein